MFGVSKLMLAIRTLLAVLFSLLMVACADTLDIPEVVEADQPQLPVPGLGGSIDFPSVPDFNQLFLAQYGCQAYPELSVLNYDPSMPIEKPQCIDGEDVLPESVTKANAEKVFDLSLGRYLYLDTHRDNLHSPEYLVHASNNSVRLIDLRNNEARGLSSFTGVVCDLMPSKMFTVESVSANEEKWHELDEMFVYVEVIADGSSVSDCLDSSLFRRYFKVPLNYDLAATDFEVCDNETNGGSSAEDCKTRQLFDVYQAEATRSVIKAFILDEDSLTPNARKLVYGYIGWGEEERKLKFWNDENELVWELGLSLDAFDVIETMDNGREYLVSLSELEDQYYMMQLGRELFLFSGRDLFEKSPAEVFSDAIYSLVARVGDGDTELVRHVKYTNDDDELVLYDDGKFFIKNYKASFSTPVSDITYSFNESIEKASSEYHDGFKFSQFDLSDCAYSADEDACTAANDFESDSWSLMSSCDLVLGCAQPSPSYDDPVNDVSLIGFVSFYDDFMRDIEFQLYRDHLLINAKLIERDALVWYDYNQPLTAPKLLRESRLFGERQVQSFSKPVVHDGGIYITSLFRDSFVGNRCYRGYGEVDCNLNSSQTGGNGECTGADLSQGLCRLGKYNFESRALYCSDAQVDAGECQDDNQITSNDRQFEQANQDAKWLPTLNIDTAGGMQKSVRVMISTDQQISSVSPQQSYVKDEGVLGNPTVYEVQDNSGAPILGGIVDGFEGEVESIENLFLLRDGRGRLEVNSAEFVGGGLDRKESQIYVNEAENQMTNVVSSTVPH